MPFALETGPIAGAASLNVLTTPAFRASLVSVNGTSLGTLGTAAKPRFRLANIGFVFQPGNLIPALNAAEQLELVYRMAG